MPLRDRNGFAVMNKRTAKGMALKFIKVNPGAGQLEIANALDVGLKYACQICRELVGEGRIKDMPTLS